MIAKLILSGAMLVVTAFAVQAEPTRCARISGGAVVEYRTFSDAARSSHPQAFNGVCPVDIPHKGVEWLPAPLVEKPAYDPATQVISEPTVTVGKDEVTTSYSVRDKTAEELATEADNAKEERLNSLDLFVLQTLCDHESRIRVLEGKSAITFAQCRQAIKDKLK